MTTTRGLGVGAAGGVFLAIFSAIVTSPTVRAAPEVPAGDYQVVYPELNMSATWNLVPCGADCTTATSQSATSFVQNWPFHLDNGRWMFSGPGQFQCEIGVRGPATFDYAFDAATLVGNGHATLAPGTCGEAAGKTYSFGFQLTKTR